MTRNYTSFLYASCLSLAVLSLNACSTTQNDEPVIEKTPITIAVNPDTRVTNNTFQPSDEVGIYVVNYSGQNPGTLAVTGNHVNNVKHTLSENAWKPATEIYWADKTTKTDFYAYYPFATVASVSAHPYSVQTDQSSGTNFDNSLFLWGKTAAVAPGTSTINITTNYVFSNMKVVLQAGSGFTEEEFDNATKSVQILNVKTDATINLQTGVATASGTARNITPKFETNCYSAIIVPQEITETSNLVKVTVNGTDFFFKKAITFQANTIHTFTLDVNKTANGGINVGVGGWDKDEIDHGGSAE